MKAKPAIDENSENVEEIITAPEKWEKILNKLRQVLQKWNTKIFKLSNDSSVCDKIMNQSKWYIRLSIFCQQK